MALICSIRVLKWFLVVDIEAIFIGLFGGVSESGKNSTPRGSVLRAVLGVVLQNRFVVLAAIKHADDGNLLGVQYCSFKKNSVRPEPVEGQPFDRLRANGAWANRTALARRPHRKRSRRAF